MHLHLIRLRFGVGGLGLIELGAGLEVVKGLLGLHGL